MCVQIRDAQRMEEHLGRGAGAGGVSVRNPLLFARGRSLS